MKLHTVVKGEGTPVVFLHAGLQTGLSDFEYQRDYFSTVRQIILPDLRGHGNSINEDFQNYFTDSAKDLKETLEELDISSAHIVGCSLGALVAVSFATQAPDMVKSLTVSGILAERPNQWIQLHEEDVKHQRQLLGDEGQVRYYNLLHNTNWREFIYLARNPDWYPFELTKSLPDIQVPILCLVGEQNRYELQTAFSYAAHEHIHVSVLPYAGHLVHSDQPEWYTSVLEHFLEQIEKVSEE